MSENAERYRWRGTDRRGCQQFGVSVLDPGELAAGIERRCRAGWRDLTVCRGDGPVPPRHGEEGQVGGIGRHDDTGRRTWWAELATAAVGPEARQ